MIYAEFCAFRDHPVEPLALGNAGGNDDFGRCSGAGGFDVFYFELSGFFVGSGNGSGCKVPSTIEKFDGATGYQPHYADQVSAFFTGQFDGAFVKIFTVKTLHNNYKFLIPKASLILNF